MRIHELRGTQGVGAGLVALAVCALLGAGCALREAPPSVDATAVDFHDGAGFAVSQNWLGMSGSGSGVREVTVTQWVAGERVELAWTKTERKETEASKAARAAAASVPIGEEADIPDAVYEDVTTTGAVTTDALNNAERILLPSYWPEGAYDVSGEENSVVWLSRQQYDELVTTRSSHIALGLFDSTLQNVIDFGESAQNALSALQGELATQEQSNADVTKLTASGDWGTYELTVNGEARTVQTVQASNMFANYTVLANPENPLILAVAMKPWSLGIGMMGAMQSINSLAGYRVTSVTY